MILIIILSSLLKEKQWKWRFNRHAISVQLLQGSVLCRT